eukprot:11334246-Heterocapsa_arctica.AAC.1
MGIGPTGTAVCACPHACGESRPHVTVEHRGDGSGCVAVGFRRGGGTVEQAGGGKHWEAARAGSLPGGRYRQQRRLGN